jgi:hypothetical protein
VHARDPVEAAEQERVQRRTERRRVPVVERESGDEPVAVRDRGRDRLVVVGVSARRVVACERSEVGEADGDRPRREQDQRFLGEADLRL